MAIFTENRISGDMIASTIIIVLGGSRLVVKSEIWCCFLNFPTLLLSTSIWLTKGYYLP